MPTQIDVKVEKVDDENIMLWVENFGHPVSIASVKEICQQRYDNGAHLDIRHLVRNIAISLSLSGTPLNNFAAIKNAIETNKFWV